MNDQFPKNKQEALTLLYLQNQDLSTIAPKQLVDKYELVYKEIGLAFEKYKKHHIQKIDY
ncbi:hypothetical protein CYJ27_08070 [Aerococcus christensenii]|uniref:Uncharacterized protein n=1 Tax=Aerococcus christensenii TaxID=87541 RepID=A0A133XXT2_9LACT|nr:hypothetical protein [Aerococcus christensenii]KXB35755.1 hypothetical protein HMPREF3187_01176 [Aerococcus christensenii]MDK8234482.1 hypothetical protein [Aerococcus christensenii]PKY90798.1 hypothetical protein CYJ27_08070 [Aerococcus christensenii]